MVGVGELPHHLQRRGIGAADGSEEKEEGQEGVMERPACLFHDGSLSRDAKRAIAHLRHENGRKVPPVPAFIDRRATTFAKSSSSDDLGQTAPRAVQPDATKAS